MKVDLSNKVALVTGAAQGIGEAIANTLATNGARVVYTDIEVELAEEAASRHPGCIAREMDVRQQEQVNDVLTETAQKLGSLDILVNNAGVNTLAHRVTIDEFPVEEWDRILEVDLRGLRRRYSELVRRYHPDRNGGDRQHEARLNRVVEAYQLLRKSGAFVSGAK